MAEENSWDSIRKHGLLSTTALLDLFQITNKQRIAIESSWRPENVTIHHPKYGFAIIRDQKPLREQSLAKLLDDMTTTEFYNLLNKKTFFWVSRERLERLLKARAYRTRPHDVLIVKTKDLVNEYKNKIWLSRINSGATIFGVGRRGKHTFQRISDYPFDEIKKRQRNHAVVELAIDYAVKNISKFIVRVEKWHEGNKLNVIWNNECD